MGLVEIFERAVSFVDTRYYVLRVSHKERPYGEIEYVNRKGHLCEYEKDFDKADGYDFFMGNAFLIKLQMENRERRNDYIIVSEKELKEINDLVDFYIKNSATV